MHVFFFCFHPGSLWSKCWRRESSDFHSITMGEQNCVIVLVNMCVHVCLQVHEVWAVFTSNCSRLGSPCCHGNQFWVFCLVIGGGLEWWRLTENDPSAGRTPQRCTPSKIIIIITIIIWVYSMRHLTMDHVISFETTVRTPWLHLKSVIKCCQFWGLQAFPGWCKQPQSPSRRSSHVLVVLAWCSGQSADFMWQQIHSLVRSLNKMPV